MNGDGALQLAARRAYCAAHLHQARVDESSDHVVEVTGKGGINHVADEVGVCVGHHDREGEEHMTLVGRERRKAGVERQPESIATPCRAAGPAAEVGLHPSGELAETE